MLSYPLKCGLLQPIRSPLWPPSVCCHTHSNAGFYNFLLNGRLLLWRKALSYPLKCGLLQPAMVDGTKVEVEICCHTHSNAGFYNKRSMIYQPEIELSYPLKCGLLQRYSKGGLAPIQLWVVIPTQMRASTTWGSSSGWHYWKGCHTHSNAGFYNWNADHTKIILTWLSYPLKCGLLQRQTVTRWRRRGRVVIPTQMRASTT